MRCHVGLRVRAAQFDGVKAKVDVLTNPTLIRHPSHTSTRSVEYIWIVTILGNRFYIWHHWCLYMLRQEGQQALKIAVGHILRDELDLAGRDSLYDLRAQWGQDRVKIGSSRFLMPHFLQKIDFPKTSAA